MKNNILNLLLLVTLQHLNAQVDTSAANFFPSKVGDTWNYQISPISTEQYFIVRDSLGEDSSRYLFYNFNVNEPYFKIDTLQMITRWPMRSIAIVKYSLFADSGDIWIVDTTDNLIAKVEDEYWSNILGVNTKIKKISYYYQDREDSLNLYWYFDEYLAAGFGEVLTQYDIAPPHYLIGCVIDGKKYGVISAINNTSSDHLISNFRLFPAFPNPFNSSTRINYTLQKNSFVDIRIYNFIGEEITQLISRKQPKGNHQITFNAMHLASGTYFVVMRTESFLKSIKITLIK